MHTIQYLLWICYLAIFSAPSEVVVSSEEFGATIAQCEEVQLTIPKRKIYCCHAGTRVHIVFRFMDGTVY